MADRRGELRELLSRLVAVDTTSSCSNLPLVELLEGELGPMGFALERQTFVDERGVTKANLVARKGPRNVERAGLALVGHTDCVPFDEAWSGALRLEEREGKLFGRGACDTKGFVAAAVVAARAQTEDRLQRPLVLAFTADEEVGCVGAKKLAQAKKLHAEYAIIGEPTGLAPVRANKGYCVAEVEVLGAEGHSAYPESGRSAILHAARLLGELEGPLGDELHRERDSAFDPPHTTLNVGLISGGKAKNVIPGNCRFTLEWRPIPSQDVLRVPKLVEEAVERLRTREPDLSARVLVLRADRGFDTPASARVVTFLEDASGQIAKTVPYGTEGPELVALGAEVAVFGPGDIRVAHRTGEFVPADELLRCEQILEEAVLRFCKES